MENSQKIKLTKLFQDFFHSEKAGGFLLMGATVISLLLANWAATGEAYQHFWHLDIGGHSLTHWINDGLMTIFFLLVGLELEREIYQGELSNVRNALLPVSAALGGMLLPAGFYLAFNYGLPTQKGAGVPMATDIAFALGVLSLLGSRVPAALKVFLTALAVMDDLGAILIIAFFYTKGLVWSSLLLSLGVFALLLLLNRMRVHALWPYLLGGVFMWYFMLQSGVHATLSGVLLAFAVPFGDGSETSPSYKLQHWLHRPVAFVIMPIFALANTAFTVSGGIGELVREPLALGIIAGLVLGKPIGVSVFSYLAVKMGICQRTEGLNWTAIVGAGMLAGIGFTMAIFIALLAFKTPAYVDWAKLSILVASVLAGTLGFVFLRQTLPLRPETEQ